MTPAFAGFCCLRLPLPSSRNSRPLCGPRRITAANGVDLPLRACENFRAPRASPARFSFSRRRRMAETDLPVRTTARAPVLVDLALQGGGSHGAYTWGVLDRLLEEPWIRIEAISGTSAGAMNAAVLVSGFMQGGAGRRAQGARRLLETCRGRSAIQPAAKIAPRPADEPLVARHLADLCGDGPDVAGHFALHAQSDRP